jgi:LysM repeat protein
MGGRNPARYLAPIALAATIAGTYLIVHSRLSAAPAPVHHAVTKRDRPRGKYQKQVFYVVQTNDNLSTISVKTGVSVVELEQLNPSVDPNALQSGQRLRLRR